MEEKENKSNEHLVVIEDHEYNPSEITIQSGEKVTWRNDDSESHTVTFTEGEFEGAELNQGDSYEQVFDETGTYDYYCDYHEDMEGSVIVE